MMKLSQMTRMAALLSLGFMVTACTSVDWSSSNDPVGEVTAGERKDVQSVAWKIKYKPYQHHVSCCFRGQVTPDHTKTNVFAYLLPSRLQTGFGYHPTVSYPLAAEGPWK